MLPTSPSTLPTSRSRAWGSGWQLVNIVGSTTSHRIATRIGARRVIYLGPCVIVSSLILLAALQTLPSLILIGVIGFTTALLRPLVMSRVHAEVTDDIRATIISLQSLTAMVLMAMSELTLGLVADRAGLPAAYLVLAAGIAAFSLALLWSSRRHFPHVVAASNGMV